MKRYILIYISIICTVIAGWIGASTCAKTSAPEPKAEWSPESGTPPPVHTSKLYASVSGIRAANPSYWMARPDFYVDHANSIGCANDTNSGTSATCVGGCSGATCPSGNGPVLNKQEFDARWGTPCPRLNPSGNVTTFHLLSDDNDTTDADPWYLCPYIEGATGLGTKAIIQGDTDGDLICSGTLGTISPNYTTITGHDSTAITGTSTSGTNPCQITAPSHGLTTNDIAYISSSTGNTAINKGGPGFTTAGWVVTVVDANNFTVPVACGPSNWVSGGTVTPIKLLGISGITGCASNLGLGYKIINTTRSNSIAWVSTIAAAAAPPWALTQPFDPITVPLTSSLVTPTKNTAWAPGDSVSVYNPYAARLVYVDPRYSRMNTSVPLTIYRMSNGGTADFNTFTIPSVVNSAIWVESASQRYLTVDPSTGGITRTGFYNSVFDDFWGGKFFAGANGSNALRFVGGMVGPMSASVAPGSIFDGNMVFAGGATQIGGNGTIGQVAIRSTAANSGTAKGFNVSGEYLIASGSYGTSVYGDGLLNIMCGGHIGYPGLTATSWLNLSAASGTVQIGNQGFACNGTLTTSFIPGAIVPQCNLALNATNLSASTTKTIGGATTLTNGLATGMFTSAVSLTSGQLLTFSTQSGIVYQSSGSTSSSTAFTLAVAYSGTTTTTATTTTTNTGFGDNAFTQGCGSMGAALGP